jgi:hypothetical protein
LFLGVTGFTRPSAAPCDNQEYPKNDHRTVRTEGRTIPMSIKITLALALLLAGLATAASYSGILRPVATLGSGGGNLVPLL